MKLVNGGLSDLYLKFLLVLILGIQNLTLFLNLNQDDVISHDLYTQIFGFFLLMPIYSSLDKCKPEPDRVT